MDELGQAIGEPGSLLRRKHPFCGPILAPVAVRPEFLEVIAVIEVLDKVVADAEPEERGRASIARAQEFRVDVKGLANDDAESVQRRVVESLRVDAIQRLLHLLEQFQLRVLGGDPPRVLQG